MLKKLNKMAKFGNSTRKRGGKSQSQGIISINYTLLSMGKKHILEPHESEKCTQHLLNFNKTGALMEV